MCSEMSLFGTQIYFQSIFLASVGEQLSSLASISLSLSFSRCESSVMRTEKQPHPHQKPASGTDQTGHGDAQTLSHAVILISRTVRYFKE